MPFNQSVPKYNEAQFVAAAELERRRRQSIARQQEQQGPPIPMTDEQAWCAAYLSIRTKQGQIQAAVWGPAQYRLFNAIAEQRAAGQPVRIVYLKARQVFVSTGTAMALWKATAFQPGQRTQVYAHDDDSAQRIFEYYQRFHDLYSGPDPLPTVTSRSKTDLVYANGSSIEVRTAGSVKGGRSRSTRRLHLDEYAFWPDAERLMTGLLQSVPDDPDTMVIIPSTANGQGGAFYDMWIAAQEGANDYLPVFFGWQDHPEYVRPLEQPADVFQDSLTNEEVALQMIGVSLEQINWRRWAIRNKCEGKVERFKQEYPSTPEEAFQASGRMRIPAYIVALHKAAPATRGELRFDQVGTREVPRFLAADTGPLWVWEPPVTGQNYVIGADPAEGIDANEDIGSSDPDYSVADVFTFPMGIQVAQLRERLTPAEFGHYLYALARWYGWAMVGLEVMGAGQGTLQVLLDRQYPLDRIARRVTYDGGGAPAGTKLGFKLTTTNREIAISGYENALASPGDGGIMLRSQISINELYNFHIIRGKPQAIAGRHDDTVFSGAHAVEAMKQAAAVFKSVSSGEKRPAAKRYSESMRRTLRESFR